MAADELCVFSFILPGGMSQSSHHSHFARSCVGTTTFACFDMNRLIFMRFAWRGEFRAGGSRLTFCPSLIADERILAVSCHIVLPRNYLLFACHATNATAQLIQCGRWTQYWKFGGREQAKGIQAKVRPQVSQPKGHSICDKVSASNYTLRIGHPSGQAEDAVSSVTSAARQVSEKVKNA
jgi:hypothetical protein